jgi:tRNA/tmRNA/rRNA uracil-C5-methylase (TrmA/RlmC/RlmD family)
VEKSLPLPIKKRKTEYEMDNANETSIEETLLTSTTRKDSSELKEWKKEVEELTEKRYERVKEQMELGDDKDSEIETAKSL